MPISTVVKKETRTTLEYDLRVHGVFGRNRSRRNATFNLFVDPAGAPKRIVGDLYEAAKVALKREKVKAGALWSVWCDEAKVESVTYSDGVVLESRLLGASSVKLFDGVVL